jgi:hypothetical protein
VLEQLALGDARENLHATAAVGRGPEAHEIQLTRVADPCRAMQRAVDLLAPPQPDVELGRADAPLVGVVEARQRVVALTRRGVGGELSLSHAPSPAFEREQGLTELPPAA